ncbi:hypothetical protein [uncultured Dubosiella sp.]|uniref:hypothetical protein n=1 Tax=uncultured Dubosiella sp. TaxID=1937011 RepID=UPI0026391C00|nr:hypothetical protein [uncultured Dubosiella sp.]
MKINKNSKIYIVTYPHYESGGPELLHQLCAELQSLGFESYMYYDDMPIHGNPVPEKFKKYNTRYVTEIEDSPQNYLIFPEAIEKTSKELKNINKIMWWLGINHYLLFSEIDKHPIRRYAKHWIMYLIGKRPSYTMMQLRKENIIFLAQCHFIVSFLNRKKIYNVPILSDYISEDFIQYNRYGIKRGDERENIVLYNPSRNTRYVKKLMKAAPEMKFIPLVGLKPDELKELISKAKVYIDFGSHPGKDRLPRECAILGCCILTSTIGSAGFYQDVPISDEYKFIRNRKNIFKVINKINEIFNNYDQKSLDFEDYRTFIKNEKELFKQDVEKIFKLNI